MGNIFYIEARYHPDAGGNLANVKKRLILKIDLIAIRSLMRRMTTE